MIEKPILFSGEMVRAILAGTKTQTRRIVKPQPTGKAWSMGHCGQLFIYSEGQSDNGTGCRWSVGDRLWVRENFSFYDAECKDVQYQADLKGQHGRGGWKPSIHMPRWASRITLAVTDVRVQRVQEISREDALAEGVGSRDAYAGLWDEINGAGSWASNPWCWCVTFTVEKP